MNDNLTLTLEALNLTDQFQDQYVRVIRPAIACRTTTTRVVSSCWVRVTKF